MSTSCVTYASSVWIACSKEPGQSTILLSSQALTRSDLPPCTCLFQSLCHMEVCQCHHLRLTPLSQATAGRHCWMPWLVNTRSPLHTSLEPTPCISDCLITLREAFCVPLMQNASIAEKFCSAQYMQHAAPRCEANPGTRTGGMARQRRRELDNCEAA